MSSKSKQPPPGPSSQDGRIYRLRPYFYLHVLDTNSNITTIVVGPKSFVRRDHELIKKDATQMINIPPRSYCIVKNPVYRAADGTPMLEEGQYKLRFGDIEIRMDNVWKVPFPLYPGEELAQDVTPLTMIKPNSAIRCVATRDFADGDVHRHAGSEWLVMGPGTYIPRIEASAVETFDSVVIGPNEALKLKARRACIDSRGTRRKAGETWLVREQGSYLRGIEEEDLGKVQAIVLTEKNALHLRAARSFKDVFGRDRKAGEEWLVTSVMSQTHIPDVDEEVVNNRVKVVTLSKQQYCVVINPVKDGVAQLGVRELRCGERSFFLEPGEILENNVQDAELLGEEEALLLRAREGFTETVFDASVGREVSIKRLPGEDWMLKGPAKYIPPVEVKIIERRPRIPLDANEGIYVRNKKTGKVRTVKGESYMLEANEELWNKELSEDVEALLQQTKVDRGRRVQQRQKWKVVTYRVPYNHAVQIYDYKAKESRVVLGPDLVMLEPDEQFSIISLSGGEPKKPNMHKSLALMLGPDFLNDTVEVETSDHARLRLSLSYNWKFDVNPEDPKMCHKIFSVRDFVGDTCKAIASRVRGAVAAETFDNFHKNSSNMIKKAVFGKKHSGDDSLVLKFEANCLCVTNVDIQQVEPVEQKTREALQGSVQLAIKIATDSQQALANVEAQRDEQVAKGKMQRQQIKDMCDAEEQRKGLVELKAKTAAVESTGQAKAEAVARCEAALIKGKAEVKQAELRAEATRIRYKARLEQLKAKQDQERTHKKAIDDLEISRKAKEATIEAEKFKALVLAIGSETIEAIARAGPELQAKMLEGLGLQGFLVTDGSSPINLFNTAQGLVGQFQ